jgi:hypothetical protein
MRIISVKRGFSRRILFDYERQALDKVPIYRHVTISTNRGKRVVTSRNPYLVPMLRDRYEIYKANLFEQEITDRSGNVKVVTRMDVDKYANDVRDWYRQHNFVDNRNVPDVWRALRTYEDDAHKKNPDDDWWNYPDDKKKKVHHPQTEVGKQRERENRKKWRDNAKKRRLGLL